MKVQITNSTRVDGVPADPGDVFDVSLDLGLRLVAAARAVAIDDTVAVLAAKETETTMLKPDEKAVAPPPEKEVVIPPEKTDKKKQK